MLSIHFARLIENHSESLAEGLVRRIQSSERTSAYRNIPTDTLKRQIQEVYENLSVWLTSKTEAEIEARYSEVGRARARGGVPVAQFTWALIMSKEYLWQFLLREAMADQAMQLLSELDFLLLLEQFFDRAIYYGVAGYGAASAQREAA
jgi:hypothetical protein